MANGDTKTESYLRVAAEGTRADLPSDTCCNTKTQNLILGVANRIMDVEDEVEELKNNPDVVDIVDTYADLQAYDTSTLTDKDIIRVLEDSTHSNGSTYYRWNATTNQFDYIGEAGGGGPTVVQTTGTSEADVMSQKAVSTMVFNDPTTKTQIHIGNNAVSTGTNSIAIGAKSSVVSNYSTAIGYYAQPTRNGEVNVGSGVYSAYGFNNTPYRVIGGVHDPVDNHDAATKGYVDGKVLQNAGAPTTVTVGTVGQLLEDTTNGKLYQCTAVDTTDPNNPSYTWTEVGAGGSITPVQTTGTSTTNVMSQNATTSMVYQDPSTKNNIQIGLDASASGTGTFGKIAIGKSATASGAGNNIAIGQNVSVSSATKGIGIGGSVPKDYCINIGGTIRNNAGTHNVAIAGEAGTSNLNYCVAIGDGSKCTRTGEVNIGASSTHGYNSSAYRILGGVYDGQLAQDAVTVNQVNSVIDAINTALSTSIPHIGA